MANQDSQRGRNRSRNGCLIALAVFIVLIVVVFVAVRQVADSISAAFTAPQAASTYGATYRADASNQNHDQQMFDEYGFLTPPLPGNAHPSHFDPFTVYPQIAAFAGRRVALHSMENNYIRPDVR